MLLFSSFFLYVKKLFLKYRVPLRLLFLITKFSTAPVRDLYVQNLYIYCVNLVADIVGGKEAEGV